MDTDHSDAMLSNLPDLPEGTVVVINTETGDYIVGETEDAALDAFEQKYDWGVPAYVHVVPH